MPSFGFTMDPETLVEGLAAEAAGTSASDTSAVAVATMETERILSIRERIAGNKRGACHLLWQLTAVAAGREGQLLFARYGEGSCG